MPFSYNNIQISSEARSFDKLLMHELRSPTKAEWRQMSSLERRRFMNRQVDALDCLKKIISEETKIHSFSPSTHAHHRHNPKHKATSLWLRRRSSKSKLVTNSSHPKSPTSRQSRHRVSDSTVTPPSTSPRAVYESEHKVEVENNNNRINMQSSVHVPLPIKSPIVKIPTTPYFFDESSVMKRIKKGGTIYEGNLHHITRHICAKRIQRTLRKKVLCH